MLGLTMYLRLFFVHTLDILFHTYYYCYDSCYDFLNKNTHTRSPTPDIIPLTSISSFESRRDTPSPPPFFNERYPTPPPLLLPPSPFKDSPSPPPSPPPFILNIPTIHSNSNKPNTTIIEKIDKTKKIEKIEKLEKLEKLEKIDKEHSKYSPEIIDMNTQNHEFEWDIILDN